MLIRHPRNIIRFLRFAEPVCDVVGLAAITLFLLRHIPPSILISGPATGGDLGSHYWPVVNLYEHGFREWTIRSWNPGNLAGEPQLVHYFPLPFILMALLGFFMPLGGAFNAGSILPALLFPPAVYACLRLSGRRFPTPLLGAALSQGLLYSESFTMWGGNLLSLLAGQFAHQYALVFLLFGVGALAAAVRKGRLPILAPLCFAGSALSHAYVFLGVPPLLLSFLLFTKGAPFMKRLKACLFAGSAAIMLAAWFIVPMTANQSWTTPHSFSWLSSNIFLEATPVILWPIIAILIASSVWLFFFSRAKHLSLEVLFWLLPISAYVVYYFIFPRLGLVDARAIPQIILFYSILAAVMLGYLMRRSNRPLAAILSLPLVFMSISWADQHSKKLPHWAAWNYSGWKNKPLSQELAALAGHLKGSLSSGRVVYEHSDINYRTGTQRVFEMLPYFSNRATLESVYLQASILSPMIWHLQALVSKTPSCPFSAYPCPPPDLPLALPKLRLFGVSDLILTSEELLSQAERLPQLTRTGVFGPWQVYHIEDSGALAAVLPAEPKLVPETNWRKTFFEWFKSYAENSPFLALNAMPPDNPSAAPAEGGRSGQESERCGVVIHADINRLALETSCPGRKHVLRFGYHPTLRADTGDPLFLLSPGFIGIVPSASKVVITFGHSYLWRASSFLSLAALVLLLFLAFPKHFRGHRVEQVQRRVIASR